MRRAILTLLCCALSGVALAQQPATPDAQAPPSAVPEVAQPAGAEQAAKPASPPEKETLAIRVRRLLDDFDQRHQERVQQMASYDKAADAGPGLKQLADPHKVELELKDERDREQTSQALANEYSVEARQVQVHEKAVQDFIAKRQKTLDDMSKRSSNINRQDLELAAANLARQPGTEAQVSELRRRLTDADRNDQQLAAERPQVQQEIAGSQEELKKLQTLEQTLEKQSKAYTADAISARQNQLNLADRLEFYIVRAKAEDVLDEDRDAAGTVQHLSASPEVRDTLASPAPSAKANPEPNPSKECAERPPDGKGCTETAAQAPKE